MKRKLLTLLLAMTVVMAMSFAGIESVFADSETIVNLTENQENGINLGTSYPSATTVYYQITPTHTGYMVFRANSPATNVTLLNSNKQAISSADFLSYGSQYDYQTYITYGVTKGKTYYVKVPYKSYTKADDGNYYVTAKFVSASVTSKYGKSKSTASKLKRSSKRYGYITAGSKAGKWYKFTSSQKKIKVYLVGSGNDTMYAKVYYKAYGHTYSIRTFSARGSGQQYYAYVSASKSSKRTYYVKVYPKSSKSSGVYYLKWK